jgi:hypothetical protein
MGQHPGPGMGAARERSRWGLASRAASTPRPDAARPVAAARAVGVSAHPRSGSPASWRSACSLLRPRPGVFAGVDGVGWRSGARRAGGSAASRLMDGPMMSPAQQDQVGQVGGAAMPPVPQMMGLTPGKGPVAAREDAAAVAHGQARRWPGWTTRVVRPTSRGWVGAPPRTGGSRAAAVWSWSVRPAGPPGSSRATPGLVGWRVTRIRVRAPSQASRRPPSGANGPAQPTSPPSRVRPWRLSRSTVTVSWGRTPPV